MEDDLNKLENGRRPQFFGKWKMTSMFWKMEYNLNLGPKLKDDLNVLANERRPQFFGKWKMTSLLWKMEEDLHFSFWKMEDNHNSKLNRRLPKC